MRKAMGTILTAAGVLGMVLTMTMYGQGETVEKQEVFNLKGGSRVRIEFTAPEDSYPLVWQLWAHTADDWFHIPGTQEPASQPWLPTGFTDRWGFWASYHQTDGESPELNFQRYFKGDLHRVSGGPGGPGGGQSDFKITRAYDYIVEPSNSVTCVENEITLEAKNFHDDTPIPSTWSVQAYDSGGNEPPTLTPINNGTEVEVRASGPGKWIVTGTKAGTEESENEITDTAVVTFFKVDIEGSSTNNFSPQLGETATIDITFEPSPPWGTGEVYFKCEIIRKTEDGGKQHIQWVDVDPSDSDFNYGRSIDVESLSLTWNGIPQQPYNSGNASQTTGPATFDGVNGSFNRILPEVNEGEPVPPPLYYVSAQIRKWPPNDEIVCEDRSAIHVPQVVNVAYADDAISMLQEAWVEDNTTIVSAFSSADIDLMKASLESDVKSYYGATVNLCFSEFSTVSMPYSSLDMVSGTGSSPYGSADHTDFGNANPGKTARVYVYRHRLDCANEYILHPYQFEIPVSPSELTTSFALTATHEVGHLLGLVKENSVLDGSATYHHNKVPYSVRRIMNPGGVGDVPSHLGRNGEWAFEPLNKGYVEFVLPTP